MRKILCLTSLILISIFTLWAQDVTTLTFTAKQENNAYQKLDSVVVTNVTKGWTEVVVLPDSVLELSSVGITSYNSNDGVVKLYQNTPNPFQGETDFRMTLNSKERVNLVIFDINGKKVAEYHNTLAAGEYLFRTTLSSPQTYLLSAVTKSGNTSIKMINLNSTGSAARIQLVQSENLAGDMIKRQSENPFAAGDNMKYIGYATQKDGSHNVTVEKQQMGSETITFVFPTEVVEAMTKVTIREAKNITATSVDMVCEMTAAEGETVTERGVCWSEGLTPAVDNDHVADTTVGTSEYTLHCEGLTNGKMYHFRAYAKTSNGVVYSKVKAVTTLTATLPTLKIDSVSNITENTADVVVTITSNGNMDVTSNGVIIDTNANPIIGSSAIQVNSKENFFVANLKDLKAGQTYYIKAYAINAMGLAYSEEVSFKTIGNTCPSVTDIEGNEYKSVLIGKQCWMAENMRTKKYSDGTNISSGILEYQSEDMGTLVYYNWAAATRLSGNTDINNAKVQGVCPNGWHVPCYNDFNELCKFVDNDYTAVTARPSSSRIIRSSDNQLAIKLSYPKYWPTTDAKVNTPSYWAADPTGFNTSGFSALATGYAKSTDTQKPTSCPGTSHLWTSVGTQAGGACDVFKIAYTETGIMFQNASSSGNDLYGVRCIKNSETGGDIVIPDDPDDTLALDGKYVIFSEQNTRSYQIYDITDPSKPVWQWGAQTDGGYSTFNNPSDVKPVYNGTCIMAVASGGGAVIVRLKDKKVLFYANPAGNPHSIELLPNNRVVVASSTGNKLTVFNIDTNRNMRTPATAVYTMNFDCGHNVVWDEGRNCLWSAGQSYLEKIEYNRTTGALTSVEKYKFPEGNTYAHDFIKIYGQDLYHMTTEQHTYEFDPNNNTFKLLDTPASVNVKSISTGPEGYPTICAIPVEGYGTNSRTWVTPYVLDFNTGKKLMTIDKAEIYKLRWWVWEK